MDLEENGVQLPIRFKSVDAELLKVHNPWCNFNLYRYYPAEVTLMTSLTAAVHSKHRKLRPHGHPNHCSLCLTSSAGQLGKMEAQSSLYIRWLSQQASEPATSLPQLRDWKERSTSGAPATKPMIRNHPEEDCRATFLNQHLEPEEHTG